MGRFILMRLLQFPLLLAVIYLVTFMLVWVAPGDPFTQGEKRVSPEVIAATKARLHATHWYTFLGYYPVLMLKGNFGPSLTYEEWSVSRIIGDALPVSVALGLFALMIAVVVGVGVGTLAAVYRGGPFDWFSLSVALVGISVPSFVVASVLFAIFSANLRWFPVGQWGRVSDLVLPGIALSLPPMAYIARLTRVAMIDTLSSDFIRTASAKGLSRTVVIWKHALKNAFLPVLSFLGPAAAATLTGSFVVEKVFNIPGLGQHFVNSILNRDRTLILGTVMVYSVFLLTLNLLVDISYAFIDPRIDVTSKKAKV